MTSTRLTAASSLSAPTLPPRLPAPKISSGTAIGELLSQAFADLPGTVEAGELAVGEEARGLLLPTAIWARWSQ